MTGRATGEAPPIFLLTAILEDKPQCNLTKKKKKKIVLDSGAFFLGFINFFLFLLQEEQVSLEGDSCSLSYGFCRP